MQVCHDDAIFTLDLLVLLHRTRYIAVTCCTNVSHSSNMVEELLDERKLK